MRIFVSFLNILFWKLFNAIIARIIYLKTVLPHLTVKKSVVGSFHFFIFDGLGNETKLI